MITTYIIIIEWSLLCDWCTLLYPVFSLFRVPVEMMVCLVLLVHQYVS